MRPALAHGLKELLIRGRHAPEAAMISSLPGWGMGVNHPQGL
jgi:hypothetical protein